MQDVVQARALAFADAGRGGAFAAAAQISRFAAVGLDAEIAVGAYALVFADAGEVLFFVAAVRALRFADAEWVAVFAFELHDAGVAAAAKTLAQLFEQGDYLEPVLQHGRALDLKPGFDLLVRP